MPKFVVDVLPTFLYFLTQSPMSLAFLLSHSLYLSPLSLSLNLSYLSTSLSTFPLSFSLPLSSLSLSLSVPIVSLFLPFFSLLFFSLSLPFFFLSLSLSLSLSLFSLSLSLFLSLSLPIFSPLFSHRFTSNLKDFFGLTKHLPLLLFDCFVL